MIDYEKNNKKSALKNSDIKNKYGPDSFHIDIDKYPNNKARIVKKIPLKL